MRRVSSRIVALFVWLHTLPVLGRLLRHRFVKFGTVGASGVVVNMAFLYAAQEHLLVHVEPESVRLNASLGIAIFFATINNFLWNRLWTWSDRRHQHAHKPLWLQFLQYALACWLGIVLQFGLTKLLVALEVHYLFANLASIVFASVFNFVVNDLWTFSRRKWQQISHPVTEPLAAREGTVRKD